MDRPNDKRNPICEALVADAVEQARRAPAPAVPQRAPELAAHAARVIRQTAGQGKV